MIARALRNNDDPLPADVAPIRGGCLAGFDDPRYRFAGRGARIRASEMTLFFMAAGAAIAGWMILGRRLLLAWYLCEVRTLDIRQAPDDAIITYPLA